MSDAEVQVMRLRRYPGEDGDGPDGADPFAEVDRLRLLMAEVADELATGPVSFADRHRLAARLRQGR